MNYKLVKTEPLRYIYHLSRRKHRASIAKKGLLPQSFHKSQWSDSPGLYYPDAIFASNLTDFTWFFHIEEWVFISLNSEYTDNIDVWRIDTLKCNNVWYADKSWPFGIFTTKKIPLKAISLFRINTKNITDSEDTLIDNLMISDYLYPVDPDTGRTLRRPRKISWPLLPHEFIYENRSFTTSASEKRLERLYTHKGSRQHCTDIIKQYIMRGGSATEIYSYLAKEAA